MGGKNSKEVTNVQNFITDITMESMTNINSECNGSLTSEQIMSYNISNNEVMNNCLDRHTPIDCKELIGDVTISGNRQDSEIFFEQNCEINTDIATQVANDIQGKLDAKASQETDAIADVLNNFSNAMSGGSSSSKTYNENNFQQNIKNVITTNFTTDFFVNVKSKLDMSADITGVYGSIAIQDNYQSILQEATSNALSKNAAVMDVLTKVEGDMSAEATQKQHGLFSTLGSMFDMFGDNAIASAVCIFICGVVIILASAIAAYTFVKTDPEKIKAIGELNPYKV